MKKLIFLIAAIAFVSLNNRAQVNEPENTNSNKWDNEKTADFVKKLASSAEAEIQLGQLAQKKATSQDVKDFANIETKEHTNALQKLNYDYKGVSSTLENKDKNLIEDLTKETGKDFDKKYIDKMVDRHKQEMEDLQDAFSKIAEPALKGWVSTTMLIINKHLGEAERIQKLLENKK